MSTKLSIYKNLDIYPGGKGKVISGEEEGKPGLKSGQNSGSQGQEEPEMLGKEIFQSLGKNTKDLFLNPSKPKILFPKLYEPIELWLFLLMVLEHFESRISTFKD